MQDTRNLKDEHPAMGPGLAGALVPLLRVGESGGMGVVVEEHGGGGFREAVLGEEGDKTKYEVGTRDQIGEGQGQS